MSLLFAGVSCLEPTEIAQACQEQDLPLDWAGRPNSFYCPAGPEPGRGWVLMRKGDLTSLSLDTLANLIFDDDNQGHIVLTNLLPIRARCVTPGNALDNDSAYLLELRDVRHLAQNEFYSNPISKQYNVRAPSGAPNIGGPPATDSYYADTLKAGALWTWQQVADDLWNAINITELGTSPTLPFAPDGNPEGLKFIYVSGWQAYNEFLFRIGCAVAPDPTAGANPFSVFQIGGADPLLAAAQPKYQAMLDEYPLEGNRAKIPAQVTVVFHRFSKHYGWEETTSTAAGVQWSINPVYVKTITDPTGTQGVESGSTATIWDDEAAIINPDGSIANQTNLQNRATARVADYYRMVKTGGSFMHQTYIGIINDQGFLPGLQVSGVSWRDTGQGYLTEIVRFPPPLRITDRAEWKWGEEKLIERLQRPDLGRATFPVYPVHMQDLQVTATLAGNPHYFLGNVMQENPDALTFTAQESCFIHALTSAGFNGTLPRVTKVLCGSGVLSVTTFTDTYSTDPQVGDFVQGRLVGVATLGGLGTRPLYEIQSASRLISSG